MQMRWLKRQTDNINMAQTTMLSDLFEWLVADCRRTTLSQDAAAFLWRRKCLLAEADVAEECLVLLVVSAVLATYCHCCCSRHQCRCCLATVSRHLADCIGSQASEPIQHTGSWTKFVVTCTKVAARTLTTAINQMTRNYTDQWFTHLLESISALNDSHSSFWYKYLIFINILNLPQLVNRFDKEHETKCNQLSQQFSSWKAE